MPTMIRVLSSGSVGASPAAAWVPLLWQRTFAAEKNSTPYPGSARRAGPRPMT